MKRSILLGRQGAFPAGLLLLATALLSSPQAAGGQPAPFSAAPFGVRLPIPPLAAGSLDGDGTRSFTLTAREGSRDFLPGRPTPTLGYNGDYLGPTLRVRRGERVRLRVENTLGEPTTVHWHGVHLPAEMDGSPRQPIASGAAWEARFEVRQPAATLWYHPHLMEATAAQVYAGLAGLLLVDDEGSDRLKLPRTYGVDERPPDPPGASVPPGWIAALRPRADEHHEASSATPCWLTGRCSRSWRRPPAGPACGC